MKILVTGATGFVGSILVEQLKLSHPEWQIIAAGQTLDSSLQSHQINTICFDIANAKQTATTIHEIKPDGIIHLAAQAHVPTAFKNPKQTYDINVIGSLNILESLARVNPNAFILFVSTAEVYGASFNLGRAITEEDLLQPQNPYAFSKASADLLAGQFAATSSLKIIRVRPFNHVGPGQSPNYVVADFAKQIAEISANQKAAEINVGNLSAERDFLDVKDVVAAYIKLIEARDNITSGEIFNVCSGVTRSIESILQDLIALAEKPIAIKIDETRFRPVDTPCALGSHEKITAKLAWQAQIPWETTLQSILQHWKNYCQNIQLQKV